MYAEFPSITMKFNRPSGIDQESWSTITSTTSRLARAIDAEDTSQAIGVAKDLVESVAKIVLTMRGEPVAENASFTGVVSKAHEALERQPGKGLTQAEPMRSVAQSAKTMACKLGELRNSYGTGHGRALEPQVTEELSQVCVEAAWLWSRWALRRLHALAQGMPTVLINDLLQGRIFRSGMLTERLLATDLTHQELATQRRIGVAVAQRAMRETFVIREDGIEECAEHDDPNVWPDAYREGAFEGLFIDPYGQLTIDSWSVQWAARVIAPLSDPAKVINKLADQIPELTMAEGSSEPPEGLLQSLRDSEDSLPPGARPAWNVLADQLSTVLDREL